MKRGAASGQHAAGLHEDTGCYESLRVLSGESRRKDACRMVLTLSYGTLHSLQIDLELSTLRGM